MDYRKHSFLKMRHIQNDNVEIQGCVNEVRERMLSEKLYIMSEYPAGNNMWEIIGQSGKYWLWAVYFNKATIVLATARQKNAGEKPQLECLAFNGFIDTGSKAYLAIAFFLLAGTAMLFIRKEYLPHIFRDDSEGGNRRKPA